MVLAPEVTVSHEVLLVAIHWQPAAVVTAIDPVKPFEARVIAPATTVYAQAAVCETVKAAVPAVITALRAADVVFAATEYVTVRDPVPLAPPVIVIHEAALRAVHELVMGLTVTPIDPVPPAAPKLAAMEDNVKLAVPAAWVTGKVMPAMVIEPVRTALVLLAATA